MDKLIFASGNKYKLEEIQTKLKDHFDVISMRELGFVGEIEETGLTLEENAALKAKYISEYYKTDCFADDSGLEIEALNGAPGVYSARFAGNNCSFDDNIEKTLSLMQGIQNRKAQFRTLICLCFNNELHYFEGIIIGSITSERHGSNGFGYDPIFKPDGFEKTFAEMTPSEKNEISHRAIAVEKLVEFLTSI